MDAMLNEQHPAMPKVLPKQMSAHWRDDFRSYASQWGFRPKSEIAKLIDYIRDEYRAKYQTDYRLRRLGKNRFLAIPGDCGDYGVKYAVDAAQRFSTAVTCGPAVQKGQQG